MFCAVPFFISFFILCRIIFSRILYIYWITFRHLRIILSARRRCWSARNFRTRHWICKGSSRWKAALMRAISSGFILGLEGSTKAGSPGAKCTIACEIIEINIKRMIRCQILRKIKLTTIASAVSKKLYFQTWTFYSSATISTTF